MKTVVKYSVLLPGKTRHRERLSPEPDPAILISMVVKGNYRLLLLVVHSVFFHFSAACGYLLVIVCVAHHNILPSKKVRSQIYQQGSTLYTITAVIVFLLLQLWCFHRQTQGRHMLVFQCFGLVTESQVKKKIY